MPCEFIDNTHQARTKRQNLPSGKSDRSPPACNVQFRELNACDWLKFLLVLRDAMPPSLRRYDYSRQYAAGESSTAAQPVIFVRLTLRVAAGYV
jgi:hypothetical protein